ncbi:hypothetical protein BH11CYA1_BH11CYA1_37490 [soil metagenome]
MSGNDEHCSAIGVSGIPMAGTISQLQDIAAEPNRSEPVNPFNLDDHGENYARDYFDDESERLSIIEGCCLPDKNEQGWSAGLQDEENVDENAIDADEHEFFLPEVVHAHNENDARFGADDFAELTTRKTTKYDSSI